ncbi:hypothetical protein CYY_000547 [Polysphondylium violaceum]|uniref:Malonyl-CoA decarboxylase C-terminal domain-containing protein n=1 Tax=Polysphondylium violaceum TaxID=133409 RepID=A0A8J4V5H4_9MYCE|nr:hypothetical protein CYY_000547 [Polysphondylium violaceum]
MMFSRNARNIKHSTTCLLKHFDIKHSRLFSTTTTAKSFASRVDKILIKNILNSNISNSSSNNNNNSNFSYVQKHYTTIVNNNSSSNNNNISMNDFFNNYQQNTIDKPLESKIDLTSKFLLQFKNQTNNNDSWDYSSIESFYSKDNQVTPTVLSNFLLIRDDIEKYILLKMNSNTKDTPTILGQDLILFDTLLGTLIKKNMKVDDLYCTPLQLSMGKEIIHQIINNEAVHPYQDKQNYIDELKQRISKNKMCLVLFHPSMKNTPLMSLYIVLKEKVPDGMESLEEIPKQESDICCAIFYSISSLHKGLKNVDLGHILISKALNYIQSNFDKNHTWTYFTLSPLPTFKSYVKKLSNKDSNLQKVIQEFESKAQSEKINMLDRIRSILEPLAYQYIQEKRKGGKTLDPVCNFHLKNGANIYRINWKGDTSEKRLEESFGMMINYEYDTKIKTQNSINYKTNHILSENQLFKDKLNKMLNH